MLMLLTFGDAAKAGGFLIAGPAALVDSCGKDVAALMDGRGGGKGGRYAGKAKDLSKRGEALELLRKARIEAVDAQ